VIFRAVITVYFK